jgi:hypothetical protein
MCRLRNDLTPQVEGKRLYRATEDADNVFFPRLDCTLYYGESIVMWGYLSIGHVGVLQFLLVCVK